MKKSEQNLLAATLDKALQPPAKKRALATDLGEYDDQKEKTPAPQTSERPLLTTSRGVTPPNPTLPVAPERNYNKRANSLDKLALPAGLFPGSSQKLYNALYVRTRGAVVPLKSIRATKRELSDWSGIRNIKTIDSHLRYFSAIGLIISRWERGQNEGSIYEVNLPEESRGLNFQREVSTEVAPPNPTSPHVTPPNVGSRQNLGSPHHQKLGSPHLTNVAVDTTTYSDGKTLYKTIERSDDDEAFAGLIAVLREAITEVTGKKPSPADASRLKEVGELLAAELKIASSRTQVTSGSAFLAEHLRRRLRKSDARQIEREVNEASREASTTSPAKPELNPEQLQEQVNLMVQRMRDGHSMEELEAQFSNNFRPVQWHMIRGMALTQLSSSTAKKQS